MVERNVVFLFLGRCCGALKDLAIPGKEGSFRESFFPKISPIGDCCPGNRFKSSRHIFLPGAREFKSENLVDRLLGEQTRI